MSICSRFTLEDVADAWTRSEYNMAKAAKLLSEVADVTISAQLMRYWVSKLDSTETDQTYDSVREIQRSRTAMTENNKLRKDCKAMTDALGKYQDLELAITGALENIRMPEPIKYNTANGTGKEMHIEALFSDWQIGKLSGDYDSKVAVKRAIAYADALVVKALQHMRNYNVTGITLALLGDIIESDKKHPNSGRACDIGTAEQMQKSIEVLTEVIFRIAQLGIPMKVICITGNHDWDGHGLNMFMAGREQLSYPLYHAIKLITRQVFPDVEFVIPEGCFYVHNIFGNNVLYEHGVGVKVNPTDMERRRDARAQQLGLHISLFRMGDKHNICRFNNDRLIVNGAFFGTDKVGGEYSAMLGFCNEPAQLVLCHVKRKENDPRSTIYDSFTIQLGHIKKESK